jgi:hypothetical protein
MAYHIEAFIAEATTRRQRERTAGENTFAEQFHEEFMDKV